MAESALSNLISPAFDFPSKVPISSHSISQSLEKSPKRSSKFNSSLVRQKVTHRGFCPRRDCKNNKKIDLKNRFFLLFRIYTVFIPPTLPATLAA